MCACRLEANSASATPQASPSGELGFEDYYPYLMEEGGGDTGGGDDSGDPEEGDVYAQLAQKERDLILAAELGKALLEKNQELTKRNENIAEEYSHKIEELTQEKHELRIRLENVEAEYETTVKELQHEISSLRHDLEEQQLSARQGDRTRSQIVHELNQQNERLADQLRKSVANEEALENEVDGLRQQIMCRRNSMHEHVHQLEVLREEINLLTDRRSELERRIHSLSEERKSLALSLEEAQDRIVMLEKNSFEQESQLRKQEREMRELQDANNRLQEKVDDMALMNSQSMLDHSTTSLLSELEMSGLGDGLALPLQNGNKDSLNSSHSSQLGSSTNRPNSLYIPGIGVTSLEDYDSEEDIECDDIVTSCHDNGAHGDVLGAAAETDYNSPCMSRSASPSDFLMTRLTSSPGHKDSDVQDLWELKQEVVEVYRTLRQMLSELRGSEGSRNSEGGRVGSPEDMETSQVKAGSLVDVLQELRALMHDLCKQSQDGSSEAGASSCGENMNILEVKVESLKQELQMTQEQLSRLKAHLALKDQQLEAKTDELTDLTNKLSLRHEELMALQAERDRLLDNAAGISPDDILTQARSDRDQALEKRNSMEVELARAKLDLMNLDCQLMEAIQQKVQLSQQLEQWEDDVHQLIDVRVQHIHEKEKEAGSKSPARSNQGTPTPPRRRLPFPWS